MDTKRAEKRNPRDYYNISGAFLNVGAFDYLLIVSNGDLGDVRAVRGRPLMIMMVHTGSGVIVVRRSSRRPVLCHRRLALDDVGVIVVRLVVVMVERLCRRRRRREIMTRVGRQRLLLLVTGGGGTAVGVAAADHSVGVTAAC